MNRTRVLYILGWGRSGSTLLANILGSTEGFFDAGELHYLWERSLVQGRRCGCGRSAHGCEVWSRVLERIGVGDGVDPGEVVGWQRSALRIRNTPSLLRRGPGRPMTTPALQRYADLTDRLYRAVAGVTGARVVVDASKIPADAALLRLLPGVEPSFLHLVRDPRAVAYSWSRVKLQHDPQAPTTMVRHGPLDSAINWTAWNLAAEALARAVGPGRFLRMRYEDVVARPREAMARIAGLAGEAGATLPFDDDRTVRLGPNHTVSGNPDRFLSGPVTIREDDAWTRNQPARDRWVTTALTLPLLPRYRYPVRARRASA